MTRRRKPRGPIPDIRSLELRARIATEQRRRREAAAHAQAETIRARTALHEAQARHLAEKAATVRIEQAREARRAALRPVAAILLRQAREDALADVLEAVDEIEWEPANAA